VTWSGAEAQEMGWLLLWVGVAGGNESVTKLKQTLFIAGSTPIRPQTEQTLG